MSNLYLMSNRKRIIGLKRQDYKFASLHQKLTRPLEKPRSPTPEIDAPPKSDSSDEASEAIASSEDVFALKKKGRRKEHATNPSSGRSEDTASRKAAATDNIKRSPTQLRHSKIGLGENPGNNVGLPRSSQKRSSSVVDNDNELGMSFSQPGSKRAKKGKPVTYTSERKVVPNIHEGSAYMRKKPRSTSDFPASKKSKSVFRNPNVDESILAKADEIDSMSKFPKFKKYAFDDETSPCSHERSQQCSKGDPATSSNDEKGVLRGPGALYPTEISPGRRRAKFKVFTLPFDAAGGPEAKMPSRPGRKPLFNDNFNVSRPKAVKDAVARVADKLGMGIEIEAVPSSATASSPTAKSFVSSGLSSAPSTLHDDSIPSSPEKIAPAISSNDIPEFPQSSQQATCPICRVAVDRALLEDFSDGSRMSIRQQTQFCKAHKRHSAEAEWQEKLYPEIDWPNLVGRLDNYRPALEDILKGKKSSFYRHIFEDNLKHEKSKSTTQSLMQGDGIEKLSPGYYGSRGARLMVENIMSQFAPKIRRLASSDQLISAGGVSGYVQSVLVPELAVLLIMDDMNVDAEGAREVLRDSVDLGILLNEEEDDEVVKDPGPDEDRDVI